MLGITGIKSISAGSATRLCTDHERLRLLLDLNTSGRLGKGSFSPAKTGVPQLIPNLNGVVGVGAAAFHTCWSSRPGPAVFRHDNGFGAIGGSHAPDGAPAESDHNVSLTASHAGESDSATPTVSAGLTVETQNQTVSGGSTPPPVITVDEPYRGLASPVRLVDTRRELDHRQPLRWRRQDLGRSGTPRGDDRRSWWDPRRCRGRAAQRDRGRRPG
ncbi:MAG: hypothetical protein R2705_00330 [Ilumatobacteraceae bacterium]